MGVLMAVNVSAQAECGGATACECGDTLNASRTLTAEDNLTDCEGTGLTFGAGGITLDCDNHEISGIEAVNGIDVNSYDGNTIQNCIIRGFDRGIFLSMSSDNNILSGNTIYNSNYGVYSDSNKNNRILNNDISDNNRFGIYIVSGMDASDHVIRGNTINSNNNPGVYMSGEDNVTIDDNTIKYNSHGIYLDASYLNLITSNTIENNTADGIYMDEASYNNTIDSNRVCYNLGIVPQIETDIHNEGNDNSGDNNICDTVFDWDDTGAVNCTHVCSWTPPSDEEGGSSGSSGQDIGDNLDSGNSFTTHRGVNMRFDYNGNEYSMEIESYTSQYEVITITLGRNTYDITLGETIHVDLDGDGQPDISVTYEGTNANTVPSEVSLKVEPYQQSTSTSQSVALEFNEEVIDEEPVIVVEVSETGLEKKVMDAGTEEGADNVRIKQVAPSEDTSDKMRMASGIILLAISILGIMGLGYFFIRKK